MAPNEQPSSPCCNAPIVQAPDGDGMMCRQCCASQPRWVDEKIPQPSSPVKMKTAELNNERVRRGLQAIIEYCDSDICYNQVDIANIKSMAEFAAEHFTVEKEISLQHLMDNFPPTCRARMEYNTMTWRFAKQPLSPSLNEQISKVQRCLSFFSSVIKSGEPWSQSCDDAFSETKAILEGMPFLVK